jgi:RNA polymerase sigma-70 factor, ECF subfamily
MSRHTSRMEPAPCKPREAVISANRVVSKPDRSAKLNQWFADAYEDLRRRASALRRQNAQAAVHTGTLVHEAWIKLEKSSWDLPESMTHFKRAAAMAMRQILRDEARRLQAGKAGGEYLFVTLDASADTPFQTPRAVLALDALLDQLKFMNERQAAVVEMRFFGGLTCEEIASELGVVAKTVERDWKASRAWLEKEMRKVQ